MKKELFDSIANVSGGIIATGKPITQPEPEQEPVPDEGKTDTQIQPEPEGQPESHTAPLEVKLTAPIVIDDALDSKTGKRVIVTDADGNTVTKSMGKSKRLNIAVSDTEYALIAAQAQSHGITQGQYVFELAKLYSYYPDVQQAINGIEKQTMPRNKRLNLLATPKEIALIKTESKKRDITQGQLVYELARLTQSNPAVRERLENSLNNCIIV